MNKKTGLGKGLSALLPGAGANTPPKTENSTNGTPETKIIQKGEPLKKEANTPVRFPRVGGAVEEVEIEKIRPNEFQPRKDFDETSIKELSDSIKIQGILQPLLVRPVNDGYEIIAGERRWRASKKAGLRKVPVIIRASTDRESLELALVENLQRENLNCVEEALSYFNLIEEFNLTQEGLSTRVGKDRSSIANSLRLLRLPQPVIQALRESKLSLGHGKALLGLEGIARYDQIIDFHTHAVKKGWSVRQTETEVQKFKREFEKTKAPLPGNKKKATSFKLDPQFQAIRERLEKNLNTKVDFKGKHEKGKILIDYFSKDDFNRIVDMLEG